MQKIDNLRWMLKEWGQWSRVGAGTKGYPTKSNFCNQSAGVTALITDDDARKIDDAVLSLRKFNESAEKTVISYYVERKPISNISKQNGKSDRAIKELLLVGEYFLGGVILGNK